VRLDRIDRPASVLPSPRPSPGGRGGRGFTLLEVIVALAVLGLALVAVADLNGGAIKMHIYAKELSAATLLARGKMLDVEQKLLADGPPADDTVLDGDFSDDGFPSYKWRAEIIRPKTENMSPQQIVGLLTGGLGMGGASSSGSSSDSSGGMGGLLGSLGALFGGGTQNSSTSSSTSNNPTSSMSGGMGGLLQGAMNMQAQTFIDSIGKMLREVKVTITWPDGDSTQTLTVVTHMVMMGAGADVNSAERADTAAAGVPSLPNGTQLPGALGGSPLSNPLNGMGIQGAGTGLLPPSLGNLMQQNIQPH
jgi:general secretion pathway protein I